jgi:PAS domain S-box-containing protein
MRLPGLAPARQEGRPVFVGPMKLTSTAAGFFVVHPVLDNGRNGGYLVGAFDLSRFFARAAQPLLAEYAVAMSVDDKVWLSQGTPSSAGIPAATASVPIGDIRWTLRLTPLRGPNTALSWVFAFLGLAMSALLANVVRLGDKARSRSRYLETIIDSSPVGMLLVEPSGLIVRANDTACALFGYEKDEPVGKRFEALMFAGGSGPADLPRPELLATGDSLIRTSLEVEALRRDGTTFMVELGVGTVALEEGRLVLAIVQDITPRYEAQKELQQRTEDLGRSNRDLEQFAYVASHDLRAPLRAVDHLSQWLTEDLDAHMTEEQRGNGRLLRRRVQRMERLLSDLLEYARVTRVHMKAELVDTTDLLNDVVAMLDWPPGFTFRPSLGLPVFETNRTALRLVFANLIGNAIKHHDRTEGRIEVEAMDAGAFHRFRVSDDGPGIPTRYHGKAFEMFQTLRPRDEVEGSGMGLALVKRLVESRGGMITVESPDTRGTTFLFTWPKKWKEGPAT